MAPAGDPQILNLIKSPPTFSSRWKYRLPAFYKPSNLDLFLIEYYNQSCIENFILNPKFERCIYSSLYNVVSGVTHSVEASKQQLYQKAMKAGAPYSPIKSFNLEDPSRDELVQPSPGALPIGTTPESDKFVIQDSKDMKQQ